jgi:phosphoribosyl-ATP pyrophosphohydrolase/phosphoribosyl-AMP cyclohydrolase/histidinol dehydrogenase
MSHDGLRRVTAQEAAGWRRTAVDEATLGQAAQIVAAVRSGGEAALREYALRFGDLPEGEALVRRRPELVAALEALPEEQRALLQRTASRIRAFAQAQRACFKDLEVPIPGGRAGHRIVPVRSAGCYAPAGRFPLPSSVLMTAVAARVAGVGSVWVASPKASPLMLAAAAAAGADALLCAGGAHAIAALAYGAGEVPACDVVVGPGNRWVTAAKHLVSVHAGIDMLAGPSELVVVADAVADPALIAADLLAQAEHDPDAMPVLVSLHEPLIDQVQAELAAQLAALPTAATARAAMANGLAVHAASIEEAIWVCDALGPEHLELMVTGAKELALRFSCYGGLFVGAGAAEVLGDYGAGPNHVLPTGGSAHHASGLSVSTFLNVRTWMRIDSDASELASDAVALARLEGLEGHARAAERRLSAGR